MRRQQAETRQADARHGTSGPRHPWRESRARRGGLLLALGLLGSWPPGAALAQVSLVPDAETAETPGVFVNTDLLQRLARGSGRAAAETARKPTPHLRLSADGQLNSRLYVSPGQPAARAMAPPAPAILAGELEALSSQAERNPDPPPRPRRKAAPSPPPALTASTSEEPASQSAEPDALSASPAPAAESDAEPPAPAGLTAEVPAEAALAAEAELPAVAGEAAPAAPPRDLDPAAAPAADVAQQQAENTSEAAVPAPTPEGPAERPAGARAVAPSTEADIEASVGTAEDEGPTSPPGPSAILSALERKTAGSAAEPKTPPAPPVPEPPAAPEPDSPRAEADPAPPPPPRSALPDADPPDPPPEADLGDAPAKPAPPARVARLSEDLQILDESRLVFEAGSTELTPESRAKLERLAEALRAAESDSLLLRAYASGRNARRLSLNRALVARAYLGTLGIESKRVVLRPLGDKGEGEPLDRVDVERQRR